jgi:hypothetical protein
MTNSSVNRLIPRNAYYAAKAQDLSMDPTGRLNDFDTRLNCLEEHADNLIKRVSAVEQWLNDIEPRINLIDILIVRFEQEITESQQLDQQNVSRQGDSDADNSQNREDQDRVED